MYVIYIYNIVRYYGPRTIDNIIAAFLFDIHIHVCNKKTVTIDTQ